MYEYQHYLALIFRFIILITSLSMLYIVIFIRKRHEFFYIAVPLSFVLSGAFSVFVEIRNFYIDWTVDMDQADLN